MPRQAYGGRHATGITVAIQRVPRPPHARTAAVTHRPDHHKGYSTTPETQNLPAVKRNESKPEEICLKTEVFGLYYPTFKTISEKNHFFFKIIIKKLVSFQVYFLYLRKQTSILPFQNKNKAEKLLNI